ncbi:MAG: DUF4249 domain-containing protein [Bacteroidetes bacterium]|nr:MAG: DUF4249 domain-containing protein [Bacteroidota bacterium]
MKVNSILWVVISCVLSNCSKVIEYELPYPGDQLVVYGLLTPDEAVRIRLTHTVAPLGSHPKDLSVAGAEVKLYENAHPLETLEYAQNGIYRSPSGFRPQTGQLYSLTIRAAGFPELSTDAIEIPSQIPIDSYNLVDSALIALNEGLSAAQLNISFTDPAAVNYYELVVETCLNMTDCEVGGNQWLLDIPETEQQRCGFAWDRNLYFKDICINDTPFTLKLGLETSTFTRSGPMKFKQVLIELRHINRSYYEYLKTHLQPEDFELAFTEPQLLYSNVKGGYGMLGAYSKSRLLIDL